MFSAESSWPLWAPRRRAPLDVSQARKLKVLEEEKCRLKRLLADAMLDNAMLRR